MNRLNELAHTVDPNSGPDQLTSRVRADLAALLRSAAAGDLGIKPISAAQEHPSVVRRWNEIADAARLAVANAKAERDDALGALRDEAALRNGIDAERDEALARNEDYRAALKSACAERDAALARVAELEKARTSPPDDRAVAAARDQRDAALYRVEQVQEAIDNAAILYRLSSESSRTADQMYNALRPMLVPGSVASGNHSAPLTGSPRPECPPNLSITQGIVPTRDEVMGAPATVAENATPARQPKGSPVPGADPAVTLAFKQSLNEASEIVKDWPEWKRSYCQSPPDRDTNRDTVTRSPTTRELVARLAEAVSNYFEDGTVTSVELVTRLRDIAADARRGGAE